jgi:anti-sigma B factor antagonist
MNVITTETEKGIIIKLEGEMMLGYEAKDFHDAIQSGLESDKKNFVIDLSKLKFISSWGIGILIHGYTTVTNAGGSFKLAEVPKVVNNALEVTKLNTIFKQYNSVGEALNA